MILKQSRETRASAASEGATDAFAFVRFLPLCLLIRSQNRRRARGREITSALVSRIKARGTVSTARARAFLSRAFREKSSPSREREREARASEVREKNGSNFVFTSRHKEKRFSRACPRVALLRSSFALFSASPREMTTRKCLWRFNQCPRELYPRLLAHARRGRAIIRSMLPTTMMRKKSGFRVACPALALRAPSFCSKPAFRSYETNERCGGSERA